MKKFFAFLFCAATLVGFAGCSDDEEDDEGILTSPDALVGKWQLVRTIEHYYEDGQWFDEPEYDVDELNGGDLFFEIYEPDGTYRFENYYLDGTLWKSGSRIWRYENGYIYHDQYSYQVIVLTESKLVMRDDYGDGEYDEDTFMRIE